jgi:capsular exopolysaccharide synthesis family protein
MGFAAAFFLEYLDTTLRSDYDLRRHLNLPCMAMVEDLGPSVDPVIVHAAPRDPLSELFNVAATVLRSYLAEREFKSAVVCSAVPREGKTTIAANLAVALARKGLRVVLVDTDLRIPQLHRIFNLEIVRGLSDLLRAPAGEGALDLTPYLAATEIPTLRILPCGEIPENPIELLESARMAEVLKFLRQENDVVLCDSPPITSVGDTLTLARLVDTAVLVVASGMSDRRKVTWTKQLLANVRSDIAGAILNFARRPEGGKYYYYYSYGERYTAGRSLHSRE